jgi:hypothetical protein
MTKASRPAQTTSGGLTTMDNLHGMVVTALIAAFGLGAWFGWVMAFSDMAH